MKNIRHGPRQTTEESNTAITTSDYIFCHNPSNLSSVVMLANHKRILEAFLKDMIDPYYFWIYEYA